MLPSSSWQYCAVCTSLTLAHMSNIPNAVHHEDHVCYIALCFVMFHAHFVDISVLFHMVYMKEKHSAVIKGIKTATFCG